jgi:branched-chain amino acid transport system ATP-binding protein
VSEDSNVTTSPSGSGSFRAVEVFRSFEGVKALAGVSFDLRRDQVTGLIGPNGAGKTTLVNVMSGVDFPDSGTIELNGEDITSWTAEKRAAAGLARTFQHGHLFDRLSARENVALGALGVGNRRAVAEERATELLERFDLTRYADTEARSLPHGEASKLGVARALAADPSFVLMDEPAAGLSEPEVPAFVANVRSICRDHHVGVLIIDHNIELIMELCDHVVVLDNGSILTSGLPAEVRANQAVASAYLGSVG